ncbi:MAG TPA: hypothetical protein VK619_20340 [Pyrinomonadaceae bacterium]|nr:hypothetical protein [Pyrinomonadaceae bacterium]
MTRSKRFCLEPVERVTKAVATFSSLVHNPVAPDSPLGEVVAWGEDTWP